MSPRKTMLAAASLTGLLGAVTGIASSLRADLFDDAFITAVFARHLAQGQGLTWVAGDPPFWGPTSLVQVVLLAACSALGADLQVASQLLAALSWAAASGLLVLLLESSGLWLALAAGLAMATSPIPLRLASGMESGLFTMLVLLVLLLRSRTRPIAAGCAAAIATLVRPEGLLLFPLLAAWSLAEAPTSLRHWRRSAMDLLPGFAVLALVVAGMAALVGSPVPQSIIAKREFGCSVSGCFSPLSALRATVLALGGVQAGVLTAAAALGLVGCLRDRGGRWLTTWGVVLVIAFTLGRAPDSPWYYVSLFPPLYACAAASLGGGTRLRRTAGALLVMAIVAGNGFVAARRIAADPWGRNARWNGEKRQLAAAILSDMAERRIESGRVLAYEVGFLGWAIPGRVDDLLGLVTPGFQPCLAGEDGDAVLARTRPDYVALVDAPTYPATGCIRTAGRLASEYRVIVSLPTHWGNRYEVWARTIDNANANSGATMTP